MTAVDLHLLPKGLGPWHVGLFFNLNCKEDDKTAKKQTEIRVHGCVHWYASVRNLIDTQDCWVPMMIVGPFSKWSDAVGFFNLWSRQTRGKARRLKRGVSLVEKYHSAYDISMWVQQSSIEHIRANIELERKRFSAVSAFTAKMTKRARIKRLLSLSDEQKTDETVSIHSIKMLKKQRVL